jgi:hypothetical protein
VIRARVLVLKSGAKLPDNQTPGGG